MMTRDFPLVAVRRADAGPSQRGHQIVCSSCRATDEVINAGRNKVIPGPLVAKRFEAAGWVVGRRDGDDLCPLCAARPRVKAKEVLPMIKTTPRAAATEASGVVLPRSEDARKARLDVDLMLVDNFDPSKGRYRDGWDDDRIAREAGMSVEFVMKRREAEHGPLRESLDQGKLSALSAEFSARELALRGKLDEVTRAVQDASVRLGSIRGEISQTVAAHAAALRSFLGEK